LAFCSALFAATALVSFPAAADECDRAQSAETAIVACTHNIPSGKQNIASGKWTGRNQAINYTNRGNSHRDAGDLDRAIADDNEAIRIGPGNYLVSAAADCLFLPRDLVARLHATMLSENAQLAVAASDGQSHPVIGLWSVSLRAELRPALVVQDIRKIDRWTARYRLATVTWPVTPLDPFFNANTMDDIAEADRLAAMDGG
jgi:hypothetical protein